jgi:uncharacterized cupin superfamily protein
MDFRNMQKSEWENRGSWKFIDFSGKHLGVRVEVLPPGGTSSIHHFHSEEEEHVLILAGSATLHLGEEEHGMVEGDHVWFEAGVEQAHHLENQSDSECRILVFGERKSGDVVVYPNDGVMMVKALGWKQFDYQQRDRAVQESRDD